MTGYAQLKTLKTHLSKCCYFRDNLFRVLWKRTYTHELCRAMSTACHGTCSSYTSEVYLKRLSSCMCLLASVHRCSAGPEAAVLSPRNNPGC